MKALVIIILIIVFGAVALAQNIESHESKVERCKVGVLLDHCPVRALASEEPSQNGNIARLYKRTNTRIRRALNFSTKYTKAKLA